MPMTKNEYALIKEIYRYCPDPEKVHSLLYQGASPNIRSSDSWPILLMASWKGCSEIVAILLNHGAIVDLATSDGKTPLWASVLMGHMDITNMLLGDGANRNVTVGGDTLLHAAVMGGHVALVRKLVSEGANREAVNDRGDTALAIAQRENKTEIIAELLSIHGLTAHEKPAQINPLPSATTTSSESFETAIPLISQEQQEQKSQCSATNGEQRPNQQALKNIQTTSDFPITQALFFVGTALFFNTFFLNKDDPIRSVGALIALFGCIRFITVDLVKIAQPVVHNGTIAISHFWQDLTKKTVAIPDNVNNGIRSLSSSMSTSITETTRSTTSLINAGTESVKKVSGSMSTGIAEATHSIKTLIDNVGDKVASEGILPKINPTINVNPQLSVSPHFSLLTN